MLKVARGSRVATILRDKEYAPNFSGPRPSANIRAIKIKEMTVAREVSVVKTRSMRKGLNVAPLHFALMRHLYFY
jgi:hypothetical protein